MSAEETSTKNSTPPEGQKPAAAPAAAAPVRGGRAGGRAARYAARTAPVQHAGGSSSLGEAPWNFPLYEMGSEETLAKLEANADILLEEVGVEFRDDVAETGEPDVLALFREAGCDVRGERVRFPKGLPRKLIAESAPREYTQHARNPANSVVIGGRRSVFAPVYGPPFTVDLEGKRRYATLDDFESLVKLAYLAPALQYSGGTVCEPTDVPVNKRHLDMLAAHIRYSDKPYMGSVTAPSRARDSVALSKCVFGEKFVDENAVMTSLINVNSPLVYDATMLGALKVYALAGQGVLVTPFVLSGAMAPCTAAGSITQILAESLAGLSLCQLLRPGCPVVMGSFVSSMSMLSGAPTFGSPEPAVIMSHLAQLARRLGVPFRTGGSMTAAKVPDAQSAYESAVTLWSCLPAGVNFMLHAGGWLEGGLAFSFEKFLLDCEQISFFHHYFRGLDMSENGQAMSALLTNEPGQHHLGSDHTRENYQTAFWTNRLADNNSFEQWASEGALTARVRANAQARKQLAEYEPPPLDPAIDEAVRDYVARKKAAEPDSWIS